MYAVLVLEMQKDFLAEGFPFFVGEMAKAIIPPLQRLLDAARERKVPVVYCNMVPIKNDVLFKKAPLHFLPGTPGAEVVDEIKPKEEDYIVPVYSMDAFLHSTLERVLRNLDVNTVIITGELTDVGCLITAMESFARGFEVILVPDCCVAKTEEKHQLILTYFKDKPYFVKLLQADEVIGQLRG